MNSLQVLATQGLLESALTCNLKFGERCVLDMKMKVKTATHHLEGLLDCVHFDAWGLTKTTLLGGYRTLSLLLIINLDVVGCTP